MDVFKLVGSVALEGADKVGSQLSTLDSKGKASSKVFDALNKASKALAVGVGAVSASLGVMVNKTAQATDRVDKMSQKIGMSRKTFQEWDFIFSQNGASVDGLQMSMKTLATQVESASKGNATSMQTFKKLGIEIRDVNGNIKDQETLFNETFSALASYGNETERTAMALTLLGRSATELAPALNSGAESIEALRDRAHELGLVLGDDVVDAGVVLTDMFDQAKRTISAVTSNAMLPLMKVMSQMTDKALGAFTKIQPKLLEFISMVAKQLPKISAVVTFVVEVIGIVLKYMGLIFKDTFNYVKNNIINPFIDWLKAFWEQNGSTILDMVKKTWDAVEVVFSVVLDNIKSIVNIFGMAFSGDWAGVWEEVKAIFTRVWEAIPTILDKAIGIIGGLGEILKNTIGGILQSMFGDEVASLYTTFVDNMVLIFTTLKDSILLIMQGFSQAFQGDWAGLWETVKTLFSTIWESIKTIAITSWTAIKNLFDEPVMYIVGKAIELKDKVVGKISEMFDSVVGFFGRLSTSVVDSFVSMKDDVIESVRNMVNDITEWFSETHLGKAFTWVGEQTEKVAGFFKGMWDKVTGHSYVPDMVSEIGDAFAKLKASMVDPAEEATSDVAESFEEMADDSISSLEKLWKFTSGIGSKIGGFAKGFGSEMISSLAGGVFGGISAGVEGFRASAEKYRKYDEEGNPEEGMTASMLGGGIAGFVMGLAQQSEQFQSLVEKLQPIMDMVIDLFGRLVEPLLPLVDVLGNMLQPLLKALEPLIDVVGEMLFDMIRMLMQFIPPLIAILTPILQLVVWTLETIVMPVMKFIYKALATMYNTIANAINSLISGINKVPFINIRWRMPTMNENLPEYQKPAESSYDVDEEEAKSYSGGTQVSEITGPTRDLFVNLLSPLASLNSLTSIGNRIYDLLDERLGSPLGVNIGEINIYGDADVNAEALADELEEILAGRMAFAMGGNA